MAMNPEDIMHGLTLFASGGQVDQGKRYLLTEAAALVKFQQHRIQQAENKQRDAQKEVTDIAAVNESLKSKMAAMVAVQNYFRQQLREMIALHFVEEAPEPSVLIDAEKVAELYNKPLVAPRAIIKPVKFS